MSSLLVLFGGQLPSVADIARSHTARRILLSWEHLAVSPNAPDGDCCYKSSEAFPISALVPEEWEVQPRKRF